MNKINTKKLLNTLENAVDNYGGWFWHEDLEGLEALEETLNKRFWTKEPNFEYLTFEVLKFLEIINKYHHIETDTIQFRANIWSDEEEYDNHGENESFDSFGEYLEYQKVCVFEDLKEALIEELFVFHEAHFKGGSHD
jgi:hypothetical protein